MPGKSCSALGGNTGGRRRHFAQGMENVDGGRRGRRMIRKPEDLPARGASYPLKKDRARVGEGVGATRRVTRRVFLFVLRGPALQRHARQRIHFISIIGASAGPVDPGDRRHAQRKKPFRRRTRQNVRPTNHLRCHLPTRRCGDAPTYRAASPRTASSLGDPRAIR